MLAFFINFNNFLWVYTISNGVTAGNLHTLVSTAYLWNRNILSVSAMEFHWDIQSSSKSFPDMTGRELALDRIISHMNFRRSLFWMQRKKYNLFVNRIFPCLLVSKAMLYIGV